LSFLTLNNLGSMAAVMLLVVLVRRYRGMRHVRSLPRYGFAGLCLLSGSMAMTAIDVTPVEMFFTPLCWTGYILWADGAIAALRGQSLLSSNRRAFGMLCAASIPLWIVFELYNLRLANWLYAGLPSYLPVRYVAYAWAFATIWPGIFETAALLHSMDWCTRQDAEEGRPAAVATNPSFWPYFSVAVGALFLIAPPLLPQEIGAYLFGAVWLGPVLLLDPLNMFAGRESLWADLRRGESDRLSALLWAGAICGLMWEFWNHAAAARWVYTFPILPDYRIFAMPVVGYLGFPVFALDCFAMYALVEPALLRIARAGKGSPEVLDL
jgi:hypothetical protein